LYGQKKKIFREKETKACMSSREIQHYVKCGRRKKCSIGNVRVGEKVSKRGEEHGRLGGKREEGDARCDDPRTKVLKKGGLRRFQPARDRAMTIEKKEKGGGFCLKKMDIETSIQGGQIPKESVKSHRSSERKEILHKVKRTRNQN